MDVAKRIGVNEMTIVNWEREKSRPDKKNLEKLKGILAEGSEPRALRI